MRTIEVEPGETIREACNTAVAEAIKFNEKVEFEFNGLKMEAFKTTSPYDLAKEYWRRFEANKLPSREEVLIRALTRFVAHTRVSDSTRWPCKECGRKSKDSHLLTIKVDFENGLKMILGCWYCNMESTIDEAVKALKHCGVPIQTD